MGLNIKPMSLNVLQLLITIAFEQEYNSVLRTYDKYTRIGQRIGQMIILWMDVTPEIDNK